MKKFLRRLFVSLMLLAVSLSVLGVAEHHRRKWRLEAYKAELVKQGVEFDLAKLIPPMPPEEDNGAFLLAAGAVQLKNPYKFNSVWPMKFLEAARARVEWRQPQPDGGGGTVTWAELSSVLESNKVALQQMREAVRKPRMNFGLNYSLGFSVATPHRVSLWRAESGLAASAVLRLHQDDVKGALADIEDMLVLANLREEERLMFAQFMALNSRYMIWAVSWEFLQKENLSDKDLKRLQTAWTSTGTAESITRTIEFERAFVLRSLNQARLDSESRREFFYVFDGWTIRKGDAAPARKGSSIKSWIKHIWDSTRHGTRYVVQEIDMTYWKYFTSYTDEEVYLQQITNVLEALKDFQEGKFASDFLRSYREHRKESLTTFERKGRLMLSQHGSGRDIPQRSFYAESMRRLMLTAIALKRYQLKQGDWPETLADLVPEYLTAVPLDPADGKMLRYTRKVEGEFLLYALGINLVDDGGDSSAEDNITYDNLFENKDWVWPMPVNDMVRN